MNRLISFNLITMTNTLKFCLFLNFYFSVNVHSTVLESGGMTPETLMDVGLLNSVDYADAIYEMPIAEALVDAQDRDGSSSDKSSRNSRSKPEPDSKSDSKQSQNSDSRPDSKSESDSRPDSKSDSGSKSESDSRPSSKSESDSRPDSKSDSGSKSESDSRPDSKSDSGSKSESDSRPDSKSDSGSKSDFSPDRKPDSKSDSNSNSKAGAKSAESKGDNLDSKGAKSKGSSTKDERASHRSSGDRKALSPEEFARGAREDLVRATAAGSDHVISRLGYEEQEKPPPPPGIEEQLRPLDDKVNRFEHRPKLIEKEPAGCGSPICVLIDSRPKRFASMCSFVGFLANYALHQRMFHLQKGDCAYAIEGKGTNLEWDTYPEGDCGECQSYPHCKKIICAAFPDTSLAYTYNTVCDLMKILSKKRQLLTLYVGLGECGSLFNPSAGLYTEWFDLDDPCWEGDIESATQNLAMAMTYSKTGRFRMCPSAYQAGLPEFQTIEGHEIPSTQVVYKDLKNQALICLNKNQNPKPGPPYFWFHRKILCRDYKIRHLCRCLYGCYGMQKDGSFKVDLPQVQTLFDECEWMSFISNEIPYNDTWDGEDRAGAIKYGTVKQVCGSKPFNAMYIDSRRRKDDVPWDETSEVITKNTPIYGFLCINKNNMLFGKLCSDYKVRYCCLKAKTAEWGAWTAWSDCSKSCSGGIKKRNRVCEDKEGAKETCFGNWIDKGEDGADRNIHLKQQVAPCNELACPNDANFTEWMAWEACPKTCGPDKRRRRRGCNPATHGGKDCPTDKSAYQEFKDCYNPACAEPMWTAWSAWAYCSLTCGLGKKRKTRQCEDTITRMPMKGGLDCIGGSYELMEDCKIKDCPIDGAWTSWQTWSTCSILCGRDGYRVHKRYCTNPLPQFEGKPCPGEDTERGPCEDLKPCPVHCHWSQWGSWCACSITCGVVGEGLMSRGRHIAIEAKYGGRKCTGEKMEMKSCPHEDMYKDKKEKVKDAIYYCPADCEWGQWAYWSKCPDCTGDLSGIYSEGLREFAQTRTRKVARPSRYRGKPCTVKGKLISVETEERQGECTEKIVPPCPKTASNGYWGQWDEWGPCVGQCGARGKMTRARNCVLSEGESGKSCDGNKEESKNCPGFCPPDGWSPWDEWTTCPVTCGSAVRIRQRHCLDDNKDEMKDKTTCKGTEKQKQSCDMGSCGSKMVMETEGVDPMIEVRRKGNELGYREGKVKDSDTNSKSSSQESNLKASLDLSGKPEKRSSKSKDPEDTKSKDKEPDDTNGNDKDSNDGKTKSKDRDEIKPKDKEPDDEKTKSKDRDDIKPKDKEPDDEKTKSKDRDEIKPKDKDQDDEKTKSKDRDEIKPKDKDQDDEKTKAKDRDEIKPKEKDQDDVTSKSKDRDETKHKEKDGDSGRKKDKNEDDGKSPDKDRDESKSKVSESEKSKSQNQDSESKPKTSEQRSSDSRSKSGEREFN